MVTSTLPLTQLKYQLHYEALAKPLSKALSPPSSCRSLIIPLIVLRTYYNGLLSNQFLL